MAFFEGISSGEATFYEKIEAATKARPILERYKREMAMLLQAQTGADVVHVFALQHRDELRSSRFSAANPFAEDQVNGYARVVHSDFSASKAEEKLDKTIALLTEAGSDLEHPSYLGPAGSAAPVAFSATGAQRLRFP